MSFFSSLRISVATLSLDPRVTECPRDVSYVHKFGGELWHGNPATFVTSRAFVWRLTVLKSVARCDLLLFYFVFVVFTIYEDSSGLCFIAGVLFYTFVDKNGGTRFHLVNIVPALVCLFCFTLSFNHLGEDVFIEQASFNFFLSMSISSDWCIMQLIPISSSY